MKSLSLPLRAVLRTWSWLLRAYPLGFREECSTELLDTLRSRLVDAQKRSPVSCVRFCVRNTVDILRGAVIENGVEYAAKRSARREEERSLQQDRKRQARTTALFESLLRDLRLAVRRLRRSPGFTVSAVLLLALGIGANTTIFSVLRAVVLTPLPYAHAERLVAVFESNPAQGWDLFSFSHPNYLDYRDQNESFDEFAAYTETSFNFSGDELPKQVTAGLVTANFYATLGVEPVLGRLFSEDEDRFGEPRDGVLLSHAFWRTQFGARSDILDERLTLNGIPRTVIGVLPAGVQFLEYWQVVAALQPNPDRHRDDHRLSVIGRLAEGVGAEQAESDLDLIAAGLAVQYPETNTGFDTRLVGLQEAIVSEDTRRGLLMLMGAVVFVLLISVTNLANLLLARAWGRQREMAVSLALGSTSARILRQLMVESTLLAAIGGALGFGLSTVGVRLLRSFDPGRVPRFDELRIDGAILLFTLVLSLATGVVAGLLPALGAIRGDMRGALQQLARGSSGTAKTSRMRGYLVIAEVAVSAVLLVGAGLLIRSSWQIGNVDPGLTPDSVLTASISVPNAQFATDSVGLSPEQAADLEMERRSQFYGALTAEVASRPGVRRVGLVSDLPFSRGSTSMSLRIEGQDYEKGAAPQAYWRIVSPEYFETLGIQLLSGRGFSKQDDWRAPGRVIISEGMARRFWPGEDAIGKRFFPWEREEDPAEVVGVVADVRERSLEQQETNVIYLPIDEFSRWSPFYLVAKTETEPEQAIASVRAAVAKVAPQIPLADIGTLNGSIDRTLASRRFNTMLLVLFAAIALALAGVGIYGLVATAVAQQRAEIGVRLALGASPGSVGALIVLRTLRWVTIGSLIGIAMAVALGRTLENLLYEVTPLDPTTLLCALLFLLLTALVATTFPALSASRTDALASLRSD